MGDDREPKRAVVFIASDAVLTAWRDRASTDQIVGISDAAEVDLLATIVRQRPQVLVLEEGFACTERGAALIGRLQTTPEFQNIDVRVLWSQRVSELAEQGSTMPLTTVATSIRPSYPAVRRMAQRRALLVNAAIDGHRAVLVDLSIGGGQVLSATALYPDQRIRLLLADSIPIDARVVWVTLEMEPAPRYRVGLEFLTFDAEALQKLIPPD